MAEAKVAAEVAAAREEKKAAGAAMAAAEAVAAREMVKVGLAERAALRVVAQATAAAGEVKVGMAHLAAVMVDVAAAGAKMAVSSAAAEPTVGKEAPVVLVVAETEAPGVLMADDMEDAEEEAPMAWAGAKARAGVVQRSEGSSD